jgi:hypothetical protein
MVRFKDARVCCIESWVRMDEGEEGERVLMILMVWPARRGVAMPWRAGMMVRVGVGVGMVVGLKGWG